MPNFPKYAVFGIVVIKMQYDFFLSCCRTYGANLTPTEAGQPSVIYIIFVDNFPSQARNLQFAWIDKS